MDSNFNERDRKREIAEAVHSFAFAFASQSASHCLKCWRSVFTSSLIVSSTFLRSNHKMNDINKLTTTKTSNVVITQNRLSNDLNEIVQFSVNHSKTQSRREIPRQVYLGYRATETHKLAKLNAWCVLQEKTLKPARRRAQESVRGRPGGNVILPESGIAGWLQ